MEATEDKSKKKSSRDESLLEALGIEQDWSFDVYC